MALPPASSVAIGDGSTLKGYIVKPDDAAAAMTVAGSAFGVETPAQFAKAYFATPADETARLTGMSVWRSSWRPTGRCRTATSSASTCCSSTTPTGRPRSFSARRPVTSDDPMTSATGPVDGLPNAYFFEQPTPDVRGDVHVFVLGQDGPLVLDVAFFSTTTIDRAADIAAFKRQFAALTP